MKIKTDFVSNSSSSTFVVAFKKRIKVFDDVRFKISRNDKAEQVLKDALLQTPKRINPKSVSLVNFLAEQLTHGYVDDVYNDYSDHQEKFCIREGIETSELYSSPAISKAFYDEHQKVQMKAATKKAADFLKENEGKYLYIFNYGDEYGEFMSEMEHGFTFASLPHIHISKH